MPLRYDRASAASGDNAEPELVGAGVIAAALVGVFVGVKVGVLVGRGVSVGIGVAVAAPGVTTGVSSPVWKDQPYCLPLTVSVIVYVLPFWKGALGITITELMR